jgi:aminoglycoside phosphotransferase (APT) family kinase protein
MASPDPDPAAVLSAIGWPGQAAACRRITAGWDTRTWRFESPDGAAHALRLYRSGGPGPDASAEAEATAMEAARDGGLPVPAVEHRGTFEGCPAFVIAWAPGKPLVDVVKARPWNVVAVGRAMGLLQARLHATPPPPGFRRTERRQFDEVAANPALAEAAFSASRMETFCHLDFHPLNVLGEGRRVTALLDWPNAAVSDRRVDLAITHVALTALPLPPGPLNAVLQAARRLLARGWRSGYRSAAGSFPLEPLFEALAVARYLGDFEAAIAEGRGWAKPRDLVQLRALLADRLRAAGIAAPAG